MASTNYTVAAGFRDYVEEISSDLFTQIFYGFRTASIVTIHEGVKGKKVWTELQLQSLARRYAASFAENLTSTLSPEILEVFACKVEHKEVPQELEDTYLGFLRSSGFNHQDWPLERFVIMKLVEKLREELENAVWQAVATDTPAAGDLMSVVFDGFLHKIENAITATTLT
ncbi:MAG: hypothetical protein AAGA31_14220, partial [Bacteroidota bacterium]